MLQLGIELRKEHDVAKTRRVLELRDEDALAGFGQCPADSGYRTRNRHRGIIRLRLELFDRHRSRAREQRRDLRQWMTRDENP